jgi:hypothetical protein
MICIVAGHLYTNAVFPICTSAHLHICTSKHLLQNFLNIIRSKRFYKAFFGSDQRAGEA